MSGEPAQGLLWNLMKRELKAFLHRSSSGSSLSTWNLMKRELKVLLTEREVEELRGEESHEERIERKLLLRHHRKNSMKNLMKRELKVHLLSWYESQANLESHEERIESILLSPRAEAVRFQNLMKRELKVALLRIMASWQRLNLMKRELKAKWL